MDNNFKGDFFRVEDLQRVINIPVTEIIDDLDSYIYYEGIVSVFSFEDDPKKIYVAGYLKRIVRPVTSIDRPGYKPIFSYSYECGDYCSRPDLKGTIQLLSNTYEESKVYYSYEEFIRACVKLDVPIINPLKIIDISWSSLEINNEPLRQNENEVHIQQNYPLELQLTLDAYKRFYIDKVEGDFPINQIVYDWLLLESRARGITHESGGQTFPNLSDTKMKAITSIIKPK